MTDGAAQCGRLMASAIYFLDKNDVEGFTNLFTPDATVEGRGRKMVGHDEIRAFMAARNPNRVTCHALTPAHVMIEDALGTAVATFTQYEGMRNGREGPVALEPPHVIGEFIQTYRMVGSTWRIASHRSNRLFVREDVQ